MTFPDPARPDPAPNTKATVSVEVIGTERQRHVLTAAEAAARRTGTVDDFTLRLAGLVQNVLDFAEQDAIEVNDSLADAFRLGEEITFAHRDMSIRFSPFSRAYDECWHSLGGEPYWLLVELILCHNAKLLADLHADMRREQGDTGLSGLLQKLLIVPEALEGDPDDARERLRRTHSRRIRLAYYIPNIFRYPTEQGLYALFEKARGLPVQRQYFLTLENTIERMEREFSLLAETIAEERRKQADRKRNNLLVAIGAAQAAGVFAAFASVSMAFAALNNDTLTKFLTEIDFRVAAGYGWQGLDPCAGGGSDAGCRGLGLAVGVDPRPRLRECQFSWDDGADGHSATIAGIGSDCRVADPGGNRAGRLSPGMGTGFARDRRDLRNLPCGHGHPGDHAPILVGFTIRHQGRTLAGNRGDPS